MLTPVWVTSLDTIRKLNVHKTFRRCPGRLLNVLCMFNLAPASRGTYHHNFQVFSVLVVLELFWRIKCRQRSLQISHKFIYLFVSTPNNISVQKMKFFNMDFFSKCDQIRRKRNTVKIWVCCKLKCISPNQ